MRRPCPPTKQFKAQASTRAQSGFIPGSQGRGQSSNTPRPSPAIPFTALRTPSNYQEQNALPKNDRPSSKSPVPLAERFAYKSKYKSKNVLVYLGVDSPAIYRLITESGKCGAQDCKVQQLEPPPHPPFCWQSKGPFHRLLASHILVCVNALQS